MILRHAFIPLDNTRLSHLCGSVDEHLRQIEAAFDVSISRRNESFRIEGANSGLAALFPLATLSLVLPTFTTTTPSGTYSRAQLAFAAFASVALWAVFVFVQTPPQSVSPAWHDSTHDPPEQTCPAAQALPHAPQLKRSVCVLAQTPPHSVSPAWQLTSHEPPEHTSPAGHATPQEPQFWLSVPVLTHVPLQFARPA